jgi:hypothetical protein
MISSNEQKTCEGIDTKGEGGAHKVESLKLKLPQTTPTKSQQEEVNITKHEVEILDGIGTTNKIKPSKVIS